LPRGQLVARGLAPDAVLAEERFFGTHPAALEAVKKGEADFAGTHGMAADDGTLSQHGKSDAGLRVLETFSGIPADVIAARAGIDSDIKDRVARAFVATALDPTALPLLETVFGASSLCLGSEASYAGWHRSLPAALASGLLVAIDDADG
jgi:ABC-type phosphate/phosphonate transport system substrate-binding protein